MPIRVVLERGLKAKKAVAFAVDWPGWSRGAKPPAGALDTLAAYRDRDTIIRHTIRVESEAFAKKVGVVIPEYGALEPGALAPCRSAYVDGMRAYQRGEIKRAVRSWTLAFLVRHSAFHTMDHAWEMEDKDLSGETGDLAAG